MTPARPVLLLVRALSIGGCERDLTKMALALDQSKYRPHVACFHPEGPRYGELAAGGIPVVKLPVTSFRSPSAICGAWHFLRYVRRHDIRLVHAFDVPTDIFAAPLGKLAGRVVITSQLSYRDMYAASERRMLRVTDKMADRIVVNSEAVKRDLLEHEGVAASRVVVSYNGVNPAVFHGRNRERKAMVAGATLVIGTVCVLRREKRLDLLLRAFAKVRTSLAGMKLLIVGSGPSQVEIENLRDELGLADEVVMAPAQDDVAPWMRSMDIFVMSSDSESFPNALLEAMACGCCVAGSRVGGIPELIEDQSNGLLFQSGDVEALAQALRKLIGDERFRRRLGAAAEATAHGKFSMEAAALRTEALYDELLGARA